MGGARWIKGAILNLFCKRLLFFEDREKVLRERTKQSETHFECIVMHCAVTKYYQQCGDLILMIGTAPTCKSSESIRMVCPVLLEIPRAFQAMSTLFISLRRLSRFMSCRTYVALFSNF